MKKRCIVLSQGPVPTPEHEKVEGGGLRCWGLAKGLAANDGDVEVTVAYHESYRQENFTEHYEGIHLATWNLPDLPKLLSEFDTVVVSYCMGDLSIKAADSLRPDQQLILDCYVPIYIEVSARQSKDLELEYAAFHHDVPRWAHVLRRGDRFLCASEPQKRFYQGVLSGIGRINPATYGEDLILVVPYGIYRDQAKQTEHPIQKLIGKDHTKFKKVLWFGGIYPWFDLTDLVEAVQKVNGQTPAKLVIVGAKNPFNTHPDFIKKYEELLEYVKKHKLEDLVVLQDWIRFEDRANWYLDSDLVVVINKQGPENELAWRTRLVDFTWANLPLITNGGDPVSELLLAADAAAQFSGLTPSAMANDMLKLFADRVTLQEVKMNLKNVRDELYWDVATKPLAEAVQAHDRAQDFTAFGSYEVVAEAPAGARAKLQRLAIKARKVPAYARKYGLRNTYHAVKTVAGRQLHRRLSLPEGTGARVVVVSHQLDMSGAPFVIMDFVRELHAAYPKLPLEFYTFNPAHNNNIATLNKAGIRPKILVNREAIINFHKGDVVVLNTSAHSIPLKETIFAGLESGQISKLLWYVHEDEPELIFGKFETQRMHDLMKAGKLEILTAAVLTRDHYREHFNDQEHIKIQHYQVVTPKKYHRVLPAKAFHDKLSFVLPGTIGDGRKGQLPIFYAFIEFLERYYHKNPKAYRDFELVYVGVTDDFLSRQLLRHAKKGLGDRFKTYGRVTKEKCLDIVLESNFTVCYSIRECLPLFVFEGMIAGHPILRNDSSGMAEQLEDGKNGYYLESSDFEQVVQTIEKTLNREKTSDEKLATMSKESNRISLAQEKHSYLPMVEEARKALDG
ncbi:MAG TPA: glycosyltransferase [Candidatus Saccharimonadales bacterium]|nr:glycosyltransferase [Candidatus Saccharimonadales bacterium]